MKFRDIELTGPMTIAALLSFNGGFVDAAGYLGLHGLFVAHVTGNFVTLGAALVQGGHGIIGKILALPEFVGVIALARLIGTVQRAHGLPAMTPLVIAKVALLVMFFALAVSCGPFPDGDTPLALLTGFAGENPGERGKVRARFNRLAIAILFFALGCAVSAFLFFHLGFWCLAVAVVVGTTAAVLQIRQGQP